MLKTIIIVISTATKPGRCPHVSNSTRCEQECGTDADCTGEWKCCNNGCGTSCLEPAPSGQAVTYASVYNETAPQYGGEPAAIVQPEQSEVTGEEGGYVSMKCIATGNPRPIITWKKDTIVVRTLLIINRILNN